LRLPQLAQPRTTQPFGESRADHLSASRPETFKLLKASIVRGLFKRLQCFNVYVMEAGRQFFAGMV